MFTLPMGLEACDFEGFSIWCRYANQLFTSIEWDNSEIFVSHCEVHNYCSTLQGWIQEFEMGGGGGGAKSLGGVYREFRVGGGGGAHPLHHPPGSSPALHACSTIIAIPLLSSLLPN